MDVRKEMKSREYESVSHATCSITEIRRGRDDTTTGITPDVAWLQPFKHDDLSYNLCFRLSIPYCS